MIASSLNHFPETARDKREADSLPYGYTGEIRQMDYPFCRFLYWNDYCTARMDIHTNSVGEDIILPQPFSRNRA